MSAAESTICVWTLDEQDGESWDTTCGNKHILINGVPIENDMHWCCYCGKPLHDAPISTEDASTEPAAMTVAINDALDLCRKYLDHGPERYEPRATFTRIFSILATAHRPIEGAVQPASPEPVGVTVPDFDRNGQAHGMVKGSMNRVGEKLPVGTKLYALRAPAEHHIEGTDSLRSA